MAEEGYGLQISLRNGEDLFNARGADADELTQILNGLVDAADKDDMAQWVVTMFGIGEERKHVSSNGSSKGSSSSSGGGGGEPTPKQLDFAKKLGIRGANRMSKREVSDAIDAKIAARDEDDDDD